MQPLLKSGQMREAESRTIAAGTPGFTLMMRAGEAAADAAARMVGEDDRVLVLCGPGNNGGDGFVVARVLANRGYRVQVAGLKPIAELSGDAAEAGHLWGEEVSDLAEADPSGADLVVDALFGTGLARDLDGVAAAAIGRVNAAGKPVLAIDIPSGVDADSGAVRGAAIQATRTVTFAARSPGRRSRRTLPNSGSQRSRGSIRRATNTTGATRSWFRAALATRARRGSRHAAPCAPEQASCPS